MIQYSVMLLTVVMLGVGFCYYVPVEATVHFLVFAAVSLFAIWVLTRGYDHLVESVRRDLRDDDEDDLE